MPAPRNPGLECSDKADTPPAGAVDRFNQFIPTCPEVRHEYAYSTRPYDDGTRKGQLPFAIDAILRF